MSSNTVEEAAGKPWFALYVKSRHEKAIGSTLATLGLEPFVPLYKRRNKSRVVDLPLFPNYVFCRLYGMPLERLSRIPGIFGVVRQGKDPASVSDAEVSALQSIVASGLPARPWPFLREGDVVRIEEGPLRGIEGHVDLAATQIVISITLLQRSVAVTVPREWIMPLALASGA